MPTIAITTINSIIVKPELSFMSGFAYIQSEGRATYIPSPLKEFKLTYGLPQKRGK
jgi:hypothetical protein